MAHSEIDANVVIELALNKVIDLQKQVILTEAKYVSLRQDFDKLKIEYDVLKSKSDSWSDSSTTTRKTTTK